MVGRERRGCDTSLLNLVFLSNGKMSSAKLCADRKGLRGAVGTGRGRGWDDSWRSPWSGCHLLKERRPACSEVSDPLGLRLFLRSSKAQGKEGRIRVPCARLPIALVDSTLNPHGVGAVGHMNPPPRPSRPLSPSLPCHIRVWGPTPLLTRMGVDGVRRFRLPRDSSFVSTSLTIWDTARGGSRWYNLRQMRSMGQWEGAPEPLLPLSLPSLA